MSYDDWLTTEDDWHDPGRLRSRDDEQYPDGPDSVCEFPQCGEPVTHTNPSVGQFCAQHYQWGVDRHERMMSKRRA